MSHPANELNPSSINAFAGQFIEIQSVDSTNNYAMAKVREGLAGHGFMYFAHEQLAGKGQRGKSWSSEAGQNIILSIVLAPAFLPSSASFSLSASIAMACFDLVTKYHPEGWSIKWPNDLYWRDRKAAGILIENIFKGSSWTFAVAGIGMNINQTLFPEPLRQAVSLKQITGIDYPAILLAKELGHFVEKRFNILKSDPEANLRSYNDHLYRKQEKIKLKKDTMVFETMIRGVNAKGQLMTADVIERVFSVGEVEFMGSSSEVQGF